MSTNQIPTAAPANREIKRRIINDGIVKVNIFVKFYFPSALFFIILKPIAIPTKKAISTISMVAGIVKVIIRTSILQK
jgi:hypothetical protein